MANILFKRGLHNNLPTTAIDGAFYLTTDTHRLYAGVGTELVDLNKYTKIYASLDDLKNNWKNAETGDFAYVVSENVMAYYNGSTWVQINTNTNTTNSSLVASNDGETGLKLTITDSDGDIVEDVIEFTGLNGITTEVDKDGNVTITGTTYEIDGTLTNSVFAITLSNSNAELESSEVILNAGDNVTFETADGGITIKAKDTILESAKFEITSELDAEGYATTSSAPVTVKDSDGNTESYEDKDSLYYTVNGRNYFNQGALPVYDKSEIDKKFNELNPMSYKGVVASADALNNKTSVKAGDTYMVSSSFTYNSTQADIGDLFIATGEEDENGYLTDVEWTLVPSGNESETDTTYSVTPAVADHSLTIKNDRTGDAIGGIDLDAGESGKITLASEAEGNTLITTIDHAPASNTNTVTPGEATKASNATVVTTLTDFVIDATGHVYGYKTQDWELESYALEGASISAEDNVATAEITLSTGSGDGESTATFVIDAGDDDNLNVTATGNTIKVSLEWGSF